jgi:hypothetical protein
MIGIINKQKFPEDGYWIVFIEKDGRTYKHDLRLSEEYINSSRIIFDDLGKVRFRQESKR